MKKKRFKSFKKNREGLDPDITSLLDVITILLFFLLKSYNPTDLEIDLVEYLTLPVSNSEQLGANAITIQVNEQQKIWVDNVQIGEIDKKSGSQTIAPLMTKLQELKAQNDQTLEKMKGRVLASEEKEAEEKKKKTYKIVNIVLDQTLPYDVLRKVMHTSATVGFSEFKFIIQSHNE